MRDADRAVIDNSSARAGLARRIARPGAFRVAAAGTMLSPVLRRPPCAFALGLAVAMGILGCGGGSGGSSTDSAAAEPANAPVEPTGAAATVDVDRAVSKAVDGQPGPLIDLLQRTHAQVRPALGAHRLDATTRFEIAPVEPPPALPAVDGRFTPARSVIDELHLAWTPPDDDDAPRFELRQSNEHDRGREVIAVDGAIFTRLPHRPWLRRDLDTDLHERWLDDAYRCVGDVVELAAPRLAVSRGETRTVNGREGLVLVLSPSDAARSFAQPDDPRASWRARAKIQDIEGELVVDPVSGAWLDADLVVKYAITAEHGAQLRGSVQVRAALAPYAELSVPKAPANAQPYPERRRLDLERDRLLDGLATP